MFYNYKKQSIDIDIRKKKNEKKNSCFNSPG